MMAQHEVSALLQAFFYLSSLGDSRIEAQLLHRMRNATNMTDEESALSCLMRASSIRELALEEFFDKWKVICFICGFRLQYFKSHSFSCDSSGQFFSNLQMDHATSNVKCARQLSQYSTHIKFFLVQHKEPQSLLRPLGRNQHQFMQVRFSLHLCPHVPVCHSASEQMSCRGFADSIVNFHAQDSSGYS